MTAASIRRIEQKGDLSSTSAADVLRSLEADRQSARVWFQTDIGVGQIEMHDGQVVLAEVGPLRRRSALLRLLGMCDGQYSIEIAPVPAAPPLISSVEAALAVMVERQQQWRELCEATPPMSAALRLTTAGKEYKLHSRGSERLVYLLVDGRRTLMELLGEAALDPIEALRVVVRGVELDHFADVTTSKSLLPLPPAEEQSGEVPRIPIAPRLPNMEGPAVSPIQPALASRSGRLITSNEYSLRKGTLAGLGADYSSSTPPPRARADSIEASPIIALSSGEDDIAEHASQGNRSAFRPVEPESRLVAPMGRDAALRVEADGVSGPVSEPADSLIGSPVPQLGEAEVQRQNPGNRVRYVGRYEVIHRIGRGGMGSVYLSRLTTQGGFRRLFAIKLLRSYLAHDNAAAEAFLAEARLAGQLHHPNVVSVVDAGVHYGQLFLVMDYVEGCSLKQLMSACPDQRPARLIVPIILDALEGLHAVHSLRADDGSPLEVVHCDVSPENLLIGADGVCRLTDLGVARRARVDGAQSTHGKPSYLAPEQVTGGAIDRRVDIFAMGVVLWTALTGERLFHGASVEETLRRVRDQPIPPPSSVGLRPDSALDAVCLRALERDPMKRFATAEEMHVALREVALGSGMLGLASEAATWVRSTIGRELSQRRLLVLEAARPANYSATPAQSAEPPQPTFEEVPISRAASSSPPWAAREFDESRTIRLDTATNGLSRYALIISAVLAACMVLGAILWPAAFSRLIRVNFTAHAPTASSIEVNLTSSADASERAQPPSNGPVPIVTPVDTAVPSTVVKSPSSPGAKR